MANIATLTQKFPAGYIRNAIITDEASPIKPDDYRLTERSGAG